MNEAIALIDRNIAMFKAYGPAHAHRVAEMEEQKAMLLACMRGEVERTSLPWAVTQWLQKLTPRDLYGT